MYIHLYIRHSSKIHIYIRQIFVSSLSVISTRHNVPHFFSACQSNSSERRQEKEKEKRKHAPSPVQ